ncbi:MAG: response regulator [Caldilineaceae bacterium]
MSSQENIELGNKETILVVEDNADLNMALCEILESYNFEVRSATNGQEALDSMSSELPDVILCDIMMPGMDGYTLLRHTRSEPQLRTRPFIFLTALTSTADQRKALDIGIEHYLTKPVDEQDLILAIRNVLRRQRDMQYEMSRQLDVLRNQIVATLQHEFRTPLTFVLGFAEYLQDIMDQEMDIEGLRTATAGILEGGHRLQRLIESFLMLAELQSREMQPDELESLTAITIMQNVIDDYRGAMTKAGLTVQVCPHHHDTMVVGEPELLHEAIKRIVDNAIRYRRPESKTIWISVKPLGETYVGLSVRDEGMGIPPGTVRALSRPFEQGDRSDRTEPGAGLSLALVHHAANLHGGRLEVSSQEGVGSEFTLWLPAAVKSKK